jgi:hypothetical protein
MMKRDNVGFSHERGSQHNDGEMGAANCVRPVYWRGLVVFHQRSVFDRVVYRKVEKPKTFCLQQNRLSTRKRTREIIRKPISPPGLFLLYQKKSEFATITIAKGLTHPADAHDHGSLSGLMRKGAIDMADVQTVLSNVSDQREELNITIPPGLFDYYWLRYIPEATFSMIQPILVQIARGSTREEIIRHVEDKFREEARPVCFNFEQQEFASELEKEEYEITRSREEKIRHVLDQNQLTYPVTVEDSIHLLFRLGILVETERDGKRLVDMVYHPFPKPQDVLTFEPAQLRRLEKLQSGEETENEADALMTARRVFFKR